MAFASYIARTDNQWRFMPHDYPHGLQSISRSAARVCRTQGSADGGVYRQPHAAICAREQATTVRNGARARKSISPSIRWATCLHCRLPWPIRAIALRSRRWPKTCSRPPEARSRWLMSIRATPDQTPRGPEPRHPARSGQTPHGQTWLRAAAATMGGRTKLRLDRSVPQTRARL
jgi:hypothetical protein